MDGRAVRPEDQPFRPTRLTEALSVLLFRAQVAEWCARIRVKPRQVRLQPMRRNWSCCSAAGIVSFSFDLLKQSAAFREYIIVRELLRLKIPRDGKRFKAFLRLYVPNYESISPEPRSIETGSSIGPAPASRPMQTRRPRKLAVNPSIQ